MGHVHCDWCGIQHPAEATVKNLQKAINHYELILCPACVAKYSPDVGITKVKVFLMECGLNSWMGIRIATEDECESIYRAMRIYDRAMEQKGE